MRRRIYIPEEVKGSLSNHIYTAVANAIRGYQSAQEDEDTLTGHLGASLKVGPRRVTVVQDDERGGWTWAIDYHKFRGRGRNATEKFLGADGIFELRVTRYLLTTSLEHAALERRQVMASRWPRC